MLHCVNFTVVMQGSTAQAGCSCWPHPNRGPLSSLIQVPPSYRSDYEFPEEPGKGSAWQCFAYGCCSYQKCLPWLLLHSGFNAERAHMCSWLVTCSWQDTRNRKADNKRYENGKIFQLPGQGIFHKHSGAKYWFFLRAWSCSGIRQLRPFKSFNKCPERFHFTLLSNSASVPGRKLTCSSRKHREDNLCCFSSPICFSLLLPVYTSLPVPATFLEVQDAPGSPINQGNCTGQSHLWQLPIPMLALV